MINELGIDRSGNDNNWTVTNMTLAVDQVVDSPTNNFATFNPLSEGYANPVLSEGNLKYAVSGNDQYALPRSTIGMSSGKWYWECYVNNGSTGNGQHVGIVGDVKASAQADLDSYSPSIDYFWHSGNTGDVKINGASASQTGLGVPATGDILGFALDMESGTKTIQFYKNGSTVGSAATYTGDIAYYTATYNHADNWQIANFGQDSSFAGTKTAQGNQDGNSIGDFYYTPPTNYLALCTSNLPAVAVIPSEHFNTIIYTGTGSTNAITGVGFQADLSWFKQRNGGANHAVFDAVRGATKLLKANDTPAEVTESDTLTTWGSDGFTLGVDSNQYVNMSSDTFVAWNWKANGSGSANTDGDMAETVTVSANTDAGFSIVTYTGDGANATVGHGLSKAPEMIIVKDRSAVKDWLVYHTGIGNTKNLRLNETDAEDVEPLYWNDTSPTASVFTLGASSTGNTDDDTYIAYCFHSVDGYSKVDSYLGNNNADGSFIYLGFRPKYFMLKASSTTDGWLIYDSARDIYNDGDTDLALYANNDPAESEYGNLDLLSNGVKIRVAASAMNENHTYIYIAFAETPFKYSNAR